MNTKVHLILVPTDFSPSACEAFSWASIFAQRFGSKLIILHVIPHDVALEMVNVPGNPWEKVIEREDQNMINTYSACLVADGSDTVEKETIVAVGEPHQQIIAIAKERNADMIVMATHGRTGFSHILMGSVAEKTIRHAPCPVFVVKPSKAMK